MREEAEQQPEDGQCNMDIDVAVHPIHHSGDEKAKDERQFEDDIGREKR
jgi:hypothetical protein